MIHSYLKTCILAVAIVAAGFTIGRAAGGGDDPRAIVYRGYLEDGAGPVSGREVKMRFRLFDQGNGGTPLWTSADKFISPQAGHFSVVLGDEKSLAEVWNSPPARLYLELTVDEGPPMSTRQELFPNAMAVMGVPQSVFKAQDAEVAGTLVAGTLSAAVANVGTGSVNGPLAVQGNISIGSQLKGTARLHITGPEDIYLLAEGGRTHVSSAWGGSGDLIVTGNVEANNNAHGLCELSSVLDSAENNAWSATLVCPAGRFAAGIQIKNRPGRNDTVDMVRLWCCEL